MNQTTAFTLIQQYIQGWKTNDKQTLLSGLSETIKIIESHGPTYSGIASVGQWFDAWLKAQGQVLKWDVLSLHFCEATQSAFCEWDFACAVAKKEYTLQGISLIQYTDQKMALIHEYRMTHPTHL